MEHQQGNQGNHRPKSNRLTVKRKDVIRTYRLMAANQGIPMGNETWKAGLLSCIRIGEQSNIVTLLDINRWLKNHRWISEPVGPLVPAQAQGPVGHAAQPHHQDLPPPPLNVPPPPVPDPDEVNVDDLFELPPYVEDEVEVQDEGGFSNGSVVNEEEEDDQQHTIQDENQPEVLNNGVAYSLHQPADNSFNAAGQVHGQEGFMVGNSHTEEVIINTTHQYATPPPQNLPEGFNEHQQHQVDGADINTPFLNGNIHQYPPFQQNPFVQVQHDPLQHPYANLFATGYTFYPPPMYYPPFTWTPTQPPNLPQQNPGQPEQNQGQPEQNQGQPEQNQGQPEQNQGQPQQNQGQPQQNQGQPQPTVTPPPPASPAATNRVQLDKAAQNIKTALLDMVKVQEYFAKNHGQTSAAFTRCTMILRHLRHRFEDILKEEAVSYTDLRPSRAYKKEVHIEHLQQNEEQGD